LDDKARVQGKHHSGGEGSVQALRHHDHMFKVLTDAMPQMVWSTLPDGHHDYYNARWYEFTGVAAGSTDGAGWNEMFHVDDRDRAWERWRHALATGEPYEIEYRLRHHTGNYRWTLGRALPVRDRNGTITRWIGTCTDIDAAKRSAELSEIMSRELSHRIKNIFAVIAGLITLSPQDTDDVRSFAEILSARVAALGRAQEFVRPHSDYSAPRFRDAMLHQMIRELLSPYPALAVGKIIVEGDDLKVDDNGATPIALTIHELATNAMKYGALSVADGKVMISTATDGENLMLKWVESGGPAVAAEPDNVGFGTMLTEISVANQLGGTIDRMWDASGLQVTLIVPVSRLRRFNALP
jgi:PAS domain S-box-containing protein